MNWIRHNGGACPVEPGTPVYVKFRDGTYTIEGGPTKADVWYWEHDGDDSDIVAFALYDYNLPEIE